MRRVRHIVYSCVPRPDAKTACLRAAVEAAGGLWSEALALSEADLAAAVRADRVDILVDLTGHTANNRLGAFAMRPAPIQVPISSILALAAATTQAPFPGNPGLKHLMCGKLYQYGYVSGRSLLAFCPDSSHGCSNGPGLFSAAASRLQHCDALPEVWQTMDEMRTCRTPPHSLEDLCRRPGSAIPTPQG